MMAGKSPPRLGGVPFSRFVANGGVVDQQMLRAIPYHPVCANKERDHFLGGAATPPNPEGEFELTFRFQDIHGLRISACCRFY